MAVTWKLNGNDVALLRLERMLLEFVNQQADRLTFSDPAAAFDSEENDASAVDTIAVTNGGSGYTSAPSVAFSGGGGSGATATAVLGGRGVASIAKTAGGQYASAPTVSLTGGGGSGATADPVMVSGLVIACTGITFGGTGWYTGDTVALSGPGGSGATATITAVAGAVTALTITNPGSGYSSVTGYSVISGFPSAGFTANFQIGYEIQSFTVTNGGSGYTSAPSVSLSGGGGSGGGAGTATLGGASVASVNVTAGGSGYTLAPDVAFSGGGGSGAEALASLVTTPAGRRWVLDQEIVLTRTEPGVASGLPVTWFRGVVRSTPASADPGGEQIEYVVEGPWQWLQRIPFLQNFKAPDDPDDTASALITYLRGRAILAQNDDGDKVQLGEFLNDVLDYAIAAQAGVMQRADFSAVTGLQITIPWDEVVDLSCAEVISRALQWVPDAVCWWDYTTNPPTLQINRRGALTAIDLPILTPGTALGDPFERAVRSGVRLRERPDLQKAGVVLIYVKTHRANEAIWETYEIDDHPDATAPDDPDTLVRTIQLAGAVTQSTILQQRVEVDPLEAYLETTSLQTSGATFSSLETWWKKHAPELRASGVTIKGFRNGSRTAADGSAYDATCDGELVKGAVTDWMEDDQGIVTEEQLIQIDCVIEVVDPDDSAKKERLTRRLSAIVTATTAATRTYSRTEATTYTPPEPTPTGLAQAVYNAISPLHYDGLVTLLETEPSVQVLVGRVLNLTGGKTAWETMAALVQAAAIDLEKGETQITIGPPRQLGPDDLVELYRVNRGRLPVTSWSTRSTGRTGSSDNRAGLALWNPVRPGGTATHNPPRVYTQAVTVAGTVPTGAEFTAALEAVYTSSNRPRAGDVVNLTVSSVVKFRAVVTLTNPGSGGIFNVSFTEDSVTYYAQITQVGVY